MTDETGARPAHPVTESPQPDSARRGWLVSVLQHRPELLARLAYFRERLQQLSRGQRRRLTRRLALPLSAVALMLALSGAPGSLSAETAATITVANNAVTIQSDGLCSLIEAINNANATTGRPHTDCVAGSPSGTDTIVLPSGGSFNLTTYDNYSYYGYNGLPAITSTVVIEGNGATIARTGNDDFRLMAVDASGDLTLNNLTLDGGSAGYYYGGAITGYKATLTLTDCTLTGNTADGGGAIYATQSDVTISNSSLTANESYVGGAIFVKYSTLTVTDSQITNNTGVDGFGGGAIYSVGGLYDNVETGDVSIVDTTISGNSNDGGGVLMVTYGELDLVDSTITNNTTKYGYGGGVYLQDVAATITGTTISGNRATNYSGGGVAVLDGTVTISRSTITNNTAGYYGGGVFALAAELTISESTIAGNTAEDVGGGVMVYSGDVAVVNSTISGNEAALGGGVRNGGTLVVANSTVSGNEATTGGGFANAGVLTLANATVTGNAANANGGGVANLQITGLYGSLSGNLALERSLISGNTAGSAGPQVHSAGAGVVATANNHNLLGASGAAGVVGLTPGPTDIVPTVGVAAILQGTLANNGGPTQTHALVANSPAIDAGPTAACAVAPINSRDQRGEFRSRNADGTLTDNECDIGAFEAPGDEVSVDFELFLPALRG